MPVQWIRKVQRDQPARRSMLAVTVDDRSISLSTALRQALTEGLEEGQELRVLFGVRRDRLAVARANPDDDDAWTINRNTGRTNNKKLRALMAEKGIANGRYIMQWNGRAKCYLSVQREDIVPRRRRKQEEDAQQATA